MITQEQIDNSLLSFKKFADKYRGIYQAVHGYTEEDHSIHLLVWDIKKRGETPLKDLLLHSHESVLLRLRTSDFTIYKATIEMLNQL